MKHLIDIRRIILLQTCLKFVCVWVNLPLTVIAITVLFSSCNSRKETDVSEKQVSYMVDFEKCMSTEKAMNISEIADTVEYVELKTPNDLFIVAVWNIIPVDDFWIIHSRDGVYKFTNKGEYVLTIGRRGQGPGEYSTLYNVDVDFTRKEIVINATGQLMYYDLDGNYLRMKKKTGTFYDIGISDSILWVCESCTNAERHIAFATNSLLDIIDSIPNPFYGMHSQDIGTGSFLAQLYKPFYRYQDTLYMKGKESNDTIYRLSGMNRKPYVAFDMGKYKLPIEYEGWYNFEAMQKNGSRYWGIPSVTEDDRHLFLLAQRYADVDGLRYVHNENNFRYIVYDKEKREGFITKGKDGTRFTDDILGGPPIWPYWVTDEYYMNVISWNRLSKELDTGKYKLSPVFEKQIAGFGYDTNPLVVLCRRKK